MGSVFELVNFVHCLGVCGVAADAPDGVGRIKDGAALLEDGDTVFDIFFEVAHLQNFSKCTG